MTVPEAKPNFILGWVYPFYDILLNLARYGDKEVYVKKMKDKQTHGFYGPAISGFCFLALALGLVRCAYTPLLPVLIQRHWLTHIQAGHLGAANFAGYVIGAITAKYFGRNFSHQRLLKVFAPICVISFFACAWHLGLVWLCFWRIFAGFASAILVILTPLIIYSVCDQRYRGRVGGIMFAGIGVGIILSGIGVPYFAEVSLSFAWLMIAVISLVLTVIALYFLPHPKEPPANHINTEGQQKFHITIPLIFLVSAYIIAGVGVIPHTLFIVQYIANHLHHGNYLGGLAWIFYGFGAILAPLAFGILSDYFETRSCLTLCYFLSIVALALPLISNHIWILYLSSFLAGGLIWAAVGLCSARLSEIMSGHNYTAWWGYATTGISASQAIAAFFMSFLMVEAHGYMWMFAIGAIAYCASVVLMIINLFLKNPTLRKC